MKKLERRKVTEIINKYIEEGKLDDFYFSECEYWSGVPCVCVYGQEIALARTSNYVNAYHIFTIYDYQTIKSVKNMLDTIIENKDIIENFAISKINHLEDKISLIERLQISENLTKKEAIDFYLETTKLSD